MRNIKFENYPQEIKEMVILISHKLEGSFYLQKDDSVFLCPSKHKLDFQNAIESGLLIDLGLDRGNIELFHDWYYYIKDYSDLRNLISEDTIDKVGNIKLRSVNRVFHCHINSQGFSGNSSDKNLIFAIIKCYHDAFTKN